LGLKTGLLIRDPSWSLFNRENDMGVITVKYDKLVQDDKTMKLHEKDFVAGRHELIGEEKKTEKKKVGEKKVEGKKEEKPKWGFKAEK
jgi:hypothetical protein